MRSTTLVRMLMVDMKLTRTEMAKILVFLDISKQLMRSTTLVRMLMVDMKLTRTGMVKILVY